MRTHFRRFAVPSPRAFSKLRRRANEIPLRRNGSSSGQAQHGAAAIEFALLFIIFFAIFYGIVSYALPMLMIQAFHHAAAAGARAGVAVDPKAFPGDPVGCTQKVETVVRTEVGQLLNWLPDKAKGFVLGPANAKVGVGVVGCPGLVTVTISYPDYISDPLIPILRLPIIGDVPKLPQDLTGTASLTL